MTESFGNRLKFERILNNKTQKECAKILEVCETTWRNWERGRSMPYSYGRKSILELFPNLR